VFAGGVWLGWPGAIWIWMRPNKKPAASTRSGGPVHVWSVVPPSLAALHARRSLPTLRAQNVGEHAARRYDASGAGIRSMPRPVITEGCRRVLLALRRSSRVADRRTPHTGPEGGFSAFQTPGLHSPRLAGACSAATCPSRRSYLRWIFSISCRRHRRQGGDVPELLAVHVYTSGHACYQVQSFDLLHVIWPC
jgi:hypothetical protein